MTNTALIKIKPRLLNEVRMRCAQEITDTAKAWQIHLHHVLDLNIEDRII